jgi:Arc/MetJ-type ribon-helix-helix transcriptional regulator
LLIASPVQVVTVTVGEDQLRWIDELARKQRSNRSRTVRECIKLAMEVEAAKEKGVEVSIPGLAPLRMDRRTYELLEDIGRSVGVKDMGELLEYVVAGMHVLIKAGVWRLLRPLPELAEEILKEESAGRRGL